VPITYWYVHRCLRAVFKGSRRLDTAVPVVFTVIGERCKRPTVLVQWMSSESLKLNSGSQPGQIIDPVSAEFLQSSVLIGQ
jgi:hypothetical protein